MLKMALSGGDATATSAEIPMGVYVDPSGAAGSTSGNGDIVTADGERVAAGWTQKGGRLAEQLVISPRPSTW